MQTEVMLEVRNLCKRFGDVQVLRGIQLTVNKGEVVAILGSSGGGKTTLLRCLNFLEVADSGDILVGQKTVFSKNEWDKQALIAPEAQLSFGLVFQQFNLFPQYSVLENLTLAPKLKARREGGEGQGEKLIEIEKKAQELLSKVGLSEKANAYPCQLSGGQQQRVAIARALMLSPEILCFDEPTSALDPELTGEVLRVIRSLKDSERTMIIVTHEIEFAKQVADKIVFISDGLVEEEGTPDEIFNGAKSEKLRAFLSDREF